MSNGYLIGESLKVRLGRTIGAVDAMIAKSPGRTIPVRLENVARAGGTKLLRGTFSGQWNKDSTATVTSDSIEYTARNVLSNVGSPSASQVNCVIALIGEEWILIAAECP